MKKKKLSWFNILIISLLALVVLFKLKDKVLGQSEAPKTSQNEPVEVLDHPLSPKEDSALQKSLDESPMEQADITTLTSEDIVIAFLKTKGQLPDYYVTKKQAHEAGWQTKSGDLCKVLPGKAIGGDYFGNFQHKLPVKKGRKYFEADLNYQCGKRSADRIIFSNDGLIYVTKDHYKTFQQK